MTDGPRADLVHPGQLRPIDYKVVRDDEVAVCGHRPTHLPGRDRPADAQLGEAFGAKGIAAAPEERDGLADPMRNGDRASGGGWDQADQRAPPNSLDGQLVGIRARVTI